MPICRKVLDKEPLHTDKTSRASKTMESFLHMSTSPDTSAQDPTISHTCCTMCTERERERERERAREFTERIAVMK